MTELRIRSRVAARASSVPPTARCLILAAPMEASGSARRVNRAKSKWKKRRADLRQQDRVNQRLTDWIGMQILLSIPECAIELPETSVRWLTKRTNLVPCRVLRDSAAKATLGPGGCERGDADDFQARSGESNQACSVNNGSVDRCSVKRAPSWRSRTIGQSWLPRAICRWAGDRTRLVMLVLGLALVGMAGCGQPELDVTYGHRRGTPGGESINGTSVLSALFEQRGFSVSTWRRLSPKLDQFDVLVWFPDEFEPPNEATRDYLENWLASNSERVLIYVGRDFDATIPYWTQFLSQVPADQRREVARRLASAQASFDARQAEVPKEVDVHWFELERVAPRQGPFELTGPWSRGIDATKTALELNTRIRFPHLEDEDEQPDPAGNHGLQMLLLANHEPVVSEKKFYNGSRMLLIVNGSFLLNLPLTNAEHRKLAGRLIARCGEPRGRRVAFLETGRDGPLIFENEPGEPYPTGLELFTVWPLGVMMLHLTALGLLACFALFPIFGRPREQPVREADERSVMTEVVLQDGDVPVTAVRAHFGKHVDALASLLEKTQDHDFARERLQEYYERVKRETPGARS
jgi:hypothetical protein